MLKPPVSVALWLGLLPTAIYYLTHRLLGQRWFTEFADPADFHTFHYM